MREFGREVTALKAPPPGANVSILQRLKIFEWFQFVVIR